MKENIRVAIRLRPLSQSEESSHSRRVTVSSKQNLRIINGESTKSLHYDYVADQGTSQERFFRGIRAEEYIARLFEGYSSTVFCYGATGSGKTFTMQGESTSTSYAEGAASHHGSIISQERGIAPRCLETIFNHLEEKAINSPKLRFKISLNYVQLYNEKIFDLMSYNTSAEHKLRWNANEMFFVEGLKTVSVESLDEALRLAVSSTKFNANSSRSHSMFTVQLDCFNEMDVRVTSARLVLVDLAGSERMDLMANHNKLREESININKSLFNLKKVITCLAEGTPGSHVPFRDSKLTCLLQHSLGGSSSCLMVDFSLSQIGCGSLADHHFEETVSTLLFAYKASTIVNIPVRSEEPGVGLISGLRKYVAELEAELKRANSQIATMAILLERLGTTPVADKPKDNGIFSSLVEKIDDIRSLDQTSRGPSSSPHNNLELSNGKNLKQQFLQTMSMVKELLVSNQSLREDLNRSNESMSSMKSELSLVMVDKEIYVKSENQDLRERLTQPVTLNAPSEERRGSGPGQSNPYDERNPIRNGGTPKLQTLKVPQSKNQGMAQMMIENSKSRDKDRRSISISRRQPDPSHQDNASLAPIEKERIRRYVTMNDHSQVDQSRFNRSAEQCTDRGGYGALDKLMLGKTGNHHDLRKVPLSISAEDPSLLATMDHHYRSRENTDPRHGKQAKHRYKLGPMNGVRLPMPKGFSLE